MKSSIHLFYGIIIGILAMFCVGQKQEDKKEDKKKFGTEIIVMENEIPKVAQEQFGPRWGRVYTEMKDIREQGWTIIDWEVEEGKHYFRIGK
jgi:hypothetical protein